MMALGFLKETHTHTQKNNPEKLTVYIGMLAFVTCLKNGFIDFAQALLVAADLC